MHVIVVGCGRVGSTVANELIERGHDVVVIDRHREAFRRLGSRFTGTTMTGVGFDRNVLARAGITDQGAVMAVTSGDNSNILIARVARETFGVERVVARIYDPKRAVIYERLGIPTVASVSWTSARALRHVLPDPGHSDWIDPTSTYALVERKVPAAAAGVSIGQLEEARLAGRAGDTNRQRPHSGQGAARTTGRPRPSSRRGGRDGRRRSGTARGRSPPMKDRDRRSRQCRPVHGATSCSRPGMTSRSIDQTAAIVDRYGSDGPVTWYLGDACELTTLEAVGAGDADVFAAVTGDDEDNLVIALLAKQEFGVPRVVAG